MLGHREGQLVDCWQVDILACISMWHIANITMPSAPRRLFCHNSSVILPPLIIICGTVSTVSTVHQHQGRDAASELICSDWGELFVLAARRLNHSNILLMSFSCIRGRGMHQIIAYKNFFRTLSQKLV